MALLGQTAGGRVNYGGSGPTTVTCPSVVAGCKVFALLSYFSNVGTPTFALTDPSGDTWSLVVTKEENVSGVGRVGVSLYVKQASTTASLLTITIGSFPGALALQATAFAYSNLTATNTPVATATKAAVLPESQAITPGVPALIIGAVQSSSYTNGSWTSPSNAANIDNTGNGSGGDLLTSIDYVEVSPGTAATTLAYAFSTSNAYNSPLIEAAFALVGTVPKQPSPTLSITSVKIDQAMSLTLGRFVLRVEGLVQFTALGGGVGVSLVSPTDGSTIASRSATLGTPTGDGTPWNVSFDMSGSPDGWSPIATASDNNGQTVTTTLATAIMLEFDALVQLATLYATTALNRTPASFGGDPGATFTLTVTDQNGTPVDGLPLTYNASSKVSGPATTDTYGQAVITLNSPTGGSPANVSASEGSLSFTVPVTVASVNVAPVWTTPEALPNVFTNAAYAQSTVATGNPAPAYQLVVGSFPPWISGINSSTGVVSGTTPATSGPYSFIVHASNTGGTIERKFEGYVSVGSVNPDPSSGGGGSPVWVSTRHGRRR